MLLRNPKRGEDPLQKKIMRYVQQNLTTRTMHHPDLLKKEGVDLKALTRRSKDHQKAQLHRHVVVADQKRRRRNLRSPVKMKTNKKRKRRKRRTEASEDAIGEDETNTSDLSFEDLKNKPIDQDSVRSGLLTPL